MQNDILLIGLPESGKTSYLAALYHYIDSDIQNKALAQTKYSSNTEYLNFIVSKWLACEPIGRTAESTGVSTKEVFLHLIDNKICKEFQLSIPDIAGESFVRQYTDRTWELDYKEQAERCHGIILFINPAKVRAHVLIDDVASVLALFEEDINDGEIDSNVTDFDVEKSPSQVMIVDILNGHSETLTGQRLNIAIVISAWDQQIELHQSPTKWLETNMPLLYQYLITNFELYRFKVFGVSAQGGSITDPEAVLTLQNKDEPAERIIVQEEGETHNNICAPIQWITGQW